MSQVGNKMRRVGSAEGHGAGGLAHWCPACRRMHVFSLDGYNYSGAKWTWDGNVEAPTFSPSMHVKVGPRPTVPEGRPDAGKIDVCHYFLKAGVIQFLNDCTHTMAGQNIPLPDLPAELLS